MISGVLTLFNWTLKMDSKSVYPHIVRAFFAFSMLFAISLAFADVFGTGSMGLRFFESVCFMNVLVITVSGISYFVTAVTEEKDAGTYALLRLAGMTSLSITLGKSTSRLISSLMLLVIQMPFTFLAITLGGVLWQQIIAAYLAMAAWMILVANLALFCSVRCATSGRAAGLAGAILALFALLPQLISSSLAAMPAGFLSKSTIDMIGRLPNVLASISVFDRLTEILGSTTGFSFLGIPLSFSAPTATAIGGIAVLFGGQFWLSLTVAATLFVVSTLTLDLWSAPTDVGGPSEKQSVRRWAVGRCWPLAIAWKEFLFFTGGRSFGFAKMLGGLLAFIGFWCFQELDAHYGGVALHRDHSWHAFLTFVAVFTIEVLVYSSGCLFFEVRQQTQSTLATVPISSVRVLLEKLLGCMIALVPSVFWIFAVIVLGDGTIADRCSLTMVSSYLLILGFSSHVAALLSLYTRWAALPLTILFSAPAFFCLAAPILALSTATSVVAQSHNIQMGLLLSGVINLFWTWIFVLLPLQIWIRDRWISTSQQ